MLAIPAQAQTGPATVQKITSQALEKSDAAPPEAEEVGNIKVKRANTAQGLIGKEVTSEAEKVLARVHDIILDDKGQAKIVVLSDGGYFGSRGKLVAVDYSALVVFDPMTDSLKLQPISRDLLEKSAAFSYEVDKGLSEGQVVSASGLSVASILDGQLFGSTGDVVADIENVVIDRDHVEYLVITVNELLDMGDKKAVIDFNEVELAKSGDSVNVQLTASQAKSFGAFLETLN